jgi:alkylation response protein AidB-like acyl-CoA dehydrogenase
MGTLDHERVTSEKVGVVLRVLDDLEPAAAAPSERLALRRLRGEAQAARLLGRRAAELLAAGRPAAAPASMAKLSIALLAQRTAELGLRLHGPTGLVEEGAGTAVGRLAAFSRACAGSTVAGGAAEIQRRVIARRGLGCAA